MTATPPPQPGQPAAYSAGEDAAGREAGEEFFDDGPLGFHWIARDGTILRANAAELALLGYAADEYVGHNISEFYVAPAAATVLARLHEHGRLRDYPVRVRASDGTLRWIAIDANVARDHGEVVHSLVVTRDITEQRRHDEDAFRLAAIVDSSDDAIVAKDLQGIIQSWNPGAEALFGYTAQDAIGRSIRMIVPADRQAEEDDVLARVSRGERVHHFDTVRQRRDGSEVHISLTVSPVYAPDGTIIGASKIARDISIRRAAEVALREAAAVKDQFLSLVSHELRTPLSIILGNGELLLRHGAGLEAKDRTDSIRDIVLEADRLQRIVENLLLLTRMDGRAELVPEPLRLERIAQQSLDAFARRHPRHPATLVVEPDLPSVSGEATLVELVLKNLLGNAAKYSAAGHEVEVEITRAPGPFIQTSVRDRGIGIGSEQVPHIFTPFYRSREAATTAKGVGIGLAVCKTAVEAQGGTIGVQPREGGGSVFTFTLPVADDDVR